MKVADIYQSVPEMGRDRQAHPFSGSQVESYIASLRLAYDCAGLDYAQPGETRMFPGFEDETGAFQVQLHETKTTGYLRGFFVANAAQGDKFVEGEISRLGNGGFRDARALSRGANHMIEAVILTRNRSGSVALVANFIREKVAVQAFHPVRTVPLHLR